jgi:hypothetical protein
VIVSRSFRDRETIRDTRVTAIKKSHRMTNFFIRRDEKVTFR